MVKTKYELFNKLTQLNITFNNYDHEAAFTVDQAAVVAAMVPGKPTKNLFLKDNKKRLWLVSALAVTKIDLKELAKLIVAPGLRFAGEDLLLQHLGVLPGSVTPFGLINDKNKTVTILFDAELFNEDVIGFHPLKNDATTVVHPNDLKKFVVNCGNTILVIDFKNMTINEN